MTDLLIEDLRVTLGRQQILNGCSATFSSGLRTVLWGRSGAGKSTLLAAIAGLITPHSGTIRLGQQTFFSKSAGVNMPPHQRRIGFVFQDLALWPHLTALAHVHLVGRSAGLTRPDAERLLGSVGLAGLERRQPGQLSGGEQQRLAIARALAGKPSVLLLDEPFSSVDRLTKAPLYELLRDVSPRVPGPTIYVTHHADDAESLAECTISLAAGRLVPAEHPWTVAE
jgi:molybdate transport system ATP-binding protein